MSWCSLCLRYHGTNVDAIDELAALLAAPPGDGTTPTPDDGTTPTPDDGTTPTPDDGTTPTPDDGTTPTPDEGTTPTPDEGTTPPGDGTTPPDEGTTPPGDGTTPPDEGTTPPDDGAISPPMETVPPADPIIGTNLSGLSRLGGLSLNRINGRFFVDTIDATVKKLGFSIDPMLVAGILADRVPKGFFPRDQIRDALLAERISIFRQEADQLDDENFGNAITPNFADFAYLDYGEKRTDKYLTSDGLHLYVRVSEKLGEGGVNFHLTDTSGNVQTYAADEVTDEFQADTIPYTFRLEETLAATHLPAWADLENGQLFSSVTLRWSKEQYAPHYESVRMDRVPGKDSRVVWESPEIGIPPDRGSTFYYFVVELAEPLSFTTLDRDKIAELDPTTVTLDDVFSEENIHEITIDGWAMPDPRNFQLVDRGIIDEMLTSDLLAAIGKVLATPEALPIIVKFLAGEDLTTDEIGVVVSPGLIRDVTEILRVRRKPCSINLSKTMIRWWLLFSVSRSLILKKSHFGLNAFRTLMMTTTTWKLSSTMLKGLHAIRFKRISLLTQVHPKLVLRLR